MQNISINNIINYNFLVVIFVLSLTGCGVQQDLGRSIDLDVGNIAEKLTASNPEFFDCFQNSDSDKMAIIESSLKACFYSKYVSVNEKSKSEALGALSACVNARYLDANFHNISDRELLSNQSCMELLIKYLIANSITDKDNRMMVKYLDNLISLEKRNAGFRFYCFDKDEKELIADMKVIFIQSINSLQKKYYRSLPYTKETNDQFWEDVFSEYESFLRIYYGKNKNFFSTSNLNNDKKDKCFESLIPEIKNYYPDFEPSKY